MKPLLELKSVSLGYGELQVVWDLTLEVYPGSIVTVVGPNGAGKTTTLKAIAGVLKPMAGTIKFKDFPIVGLSPQQLVDLGIAYVPEGRCIFSELTVYENLKVGAYSKKARKGFKENLAMVYDLFPILKEKSSQLGGTLSGGEQQMLAIGRALMSQPELLLLDEPSLGLSPLVVKSLFSLLVALKQLGITILLIEQNVYQALKISDYAYVMKDGTIAMEGPATKLIESPEIWRMYISRTRARVDQSLLP